MINISESAKTEVLRLKEEQSLGEKDFLRLSVAGGGCSGLSYKIDFDNEQQDNDQVFEDKGITIVIEIKSYLYLCGTVLDFSKGLNGQGFNFVNPNAARTCACGESFSV